MAAGGDAALEDDMGGTGRRGARRGRRWRTAGSAAAVRAVARASRALGRGSGSVIGGRVGLVLDPGLLGALGAGREICLVSGTNGKTTTTAMIAAALSITGPVASSSEGSNMTAGLVSALCATPGAHYAALEVDEGYLPGAIGDLRPRLVVLLNLSRDQLDRIGEVAMLADAWRGALSGTATTVVANADDPLSCYAARGSTDAHFVGVGGLWRADAEHCPVCGGRIAFSRRGSGWACACGFARPATLAELDGSTLELERGERVELGGGLPGRFNVANAAVAVVAAQHLGIAPQVAARAIGAIGSVGGRFKVLETPLGRARLLLAKNPAGWTETLELVRGRPGGLVLAINARPEDGRDPSWLFDVPFEVLSGRTVVAAGERRLDLAVRLRHAGVDHLVEADAAAAIAATGAAEVDVIANYSAFFELRRRFEPRRGARAGPDRAARPGPMMRAPGPAPTAPAALAGRELVVVLVYPDLLGTYGDSGNAAILVNRARWRGVAARLVVARSDDPLPGGGDLYVLGGGEDGPQARAAAALRASGLVDAVRAGAVVFGVCAGFQLLGRSFPAGDGYHEGAGILAAEAVRVDRRRAVGEIRAEAAGALAGLGTLTGFENHAARTRLDTGTAPLARVRLGIGNDEASGADGAQSGRVLATYLHGPVLARNPRLADHLLGLALGTDLGELDDHEELALRAERLAHPLRRPGRAGAAMLSYRRAR